jgi:hypothetical protein
MPCNLCLRAPLASALLLATTLTFSTSGCKAPRDSTSNLKTAIDSYYEQWPECLWPQPLQLPQQKDTDNATAVQPFDALVDQGLMSRTPIEKTKLLILKKQANSYDLTDKGRANWTPDTTQPGYGNFCYAHRKVNDVLSNTPAGTQPGATTTVSYTWSLGDVKDWAQAPETENAFPQIRTALSTTSNNAQTTLVLTAEGWKVQPSTLQPAMQKRGVGGDSGIVQ